MHTAAMLRTDCSATALVATIFMCQITGLLWAKAKTQSTHEKSKPDEQNNIFQCSVLFSWHSLQEIILKEDFLYMQNNSMI